MTIDDAKEKLHELIDRADESKILEILALFEEHPGPSAYTYSEEMLNILNERSEQYLSGKTKLYSIEESLALLRQHRKDNGI